MRNAKIKYPIDDLYLSAYDRWVLANHPLRTSKDEIPNKETISKENHTIRKVD